MHHSRRAMYVCQGGALMTGEAECWAAGLGVAYGYGYALSDVVAAE